MFAIIESKELIEVTNVWMIIIMRVLCKTIVRRNDWLKKKYTKEFRGNMLTATKINCFVILSVSSFEFGRFYFFKFLINTSELTSIPDFDCINLEPTSFALHTTNNHDFIFILQHLYYLVRKVTRTKFLWHCRR